VSDHRFWAVQSLVTEPGPAAAAIDRLPSDLGALRAASQQLVFHYWYWAGGDYAANGIAPERISEIDTRYAAAMFARLSELADLPLSAAREPSPPLADLRSAYRRPEFVVPDTVTSYSPARTDVPAVVDVSAVARAAS
jgi:hypothetical protein